MVVDIAIAGGGPAGLAAAIAARRHGLSVAVFEGVASAGPIDKCCGEGLSPEAVDALRRLGVVLPAFMPFAGIRFWDDDCAAEARFRGQAGVGVRRTLLHTFLTDRARDAGVALYRGAPVRSLALEGVRCRWIVAADGSQSVLRRAAGLETGTRHSRRFGFRRHFRVEPWSDLVEVHWAHRAQAYVTPVAENEVGVAIIAGNPLRRFEDLLPLFPALRARLGRAEGVSNLRGAVTASRRFPRVTSGNVALIGDASGSVDAITGLGLSLAFQQAVALGEALAAGDLARYEAAHRRIETVPHAMEWLMLAMDRRDWFRRRAIRALAAEPRHFSRLLALNAGAFPPVSSALSVPLALGWRFFTA